MTCVCTELCLSTNHGTNSVFELWNFYFVAAIKKTEISKQNKSLLSIVSMNTKTKNSCVARWRSESSAYTRPDVLGFIRFSIC